MAVAEGFSLQVPLIFLTERGNYTRALCLLHPRLPRKETGKSGQMENICVFSLPDRCDSPRRAVYLSQVCRGTEHSPVRTEGCFPLPTFLRCTATPLLQHLLYFSARSQVLCCAEEGKEVVQCSLAEAGTRTVKRWTMWVDDSYLCSSSSLCSLTEVFTVKWRKNGDKSCAGECTGREAPKASLQCQYQAANRSVWDIQFLVVRVVNWN